VLPTYRGPFEAHLKADTHGGWGAQVNNIGVPDGNIPDELRADVKAMHFRQGVGELASLVSEAARANQSVVANQFPTDLAVLTPVVQGYQTVRLWKELPVTVVAGILDSVRSKALEFTLEIEAANPEAGDVGLGDAPPVPAATADLIFNTVIFGGQNAIGPGATVNVTPGDLGSLLEYLAEQGVAEDDRAELATAVKADDGQFGSRVKAWLGAMTAKLATAGGAVAEKATIAIITAAVLRYFGVG
jgi:hypothetical protein